MVDRDPIPELQLKLRRTDSCDLMAGLAALQLMPENADRMAVIEATAEFALSLRPAAGQRRPSLSEWRPLISNFDMTTDPAEGVFTDSLIVPHYGPATVVSGRDPSAVWIQSAFTAAFLGGPRLPNEALRVEAIGMIRATLRLADAVARRAGLARGMRVVRSKGREIILPPPDRFDQLARAVRFSADELRNAVGEREAEFLAPLVVKFGHAFDPAASLTGDLHRRPFVVHEQELIVALPGMIVPALTGALIDVAGAHRPALAQRFRAAVRDAVHEAIREMKVEEPILEDVWDADQPFLTSVIRTDRDLLWTVHVAVDPLTQYDEGGIDGTWSEAQTVLDAMQDRATQIERIYSAFPPSSAPNGFLHVYVLQGIGRAHQVGLVAALPPLESPRVLLSAAELATIAVVEDHDPLALLKFSRASERFHERVRVLSFDTLSTYGLYRRYERSFYIGDEVPTLVAVDASFAKELRERAHTERDVHAVALPGRYEFALVRVLEDDVRVPLYAPLAPIDDVIHVLAAMDADCWVVAGIPEHPQGLTIALNLVHAVAFWLWQLWPSAGGLLWRASTDGQFVASLQLAPRPEYDDVTDEAPGEIAVAAARGGVEVAVPSTFVNALGTADNAGERALMRAVLRAARDRAAADGQPVPADPELDQWLDTHAPLGRKKKSLLLPPERNIDLLDQGLPPIRRIQEPDLAEALDDLGDALRATGRTHGPIPAGERLVVLQDAVYWSFDEMERLGLSLDPASALERAIAQHEKILERQALERATVPTRIACYDQILPELRQNIERERATLLHSAMAARVVIEILATRPPRGLRPMTIRVYDRLMALASEGMNRAFDRDALQNGLHDNQMSILPTGRLGVRREGKFRTGQVTFMEVNARTQIEHAESSFASRWRTERSTLSWEGSAVDRAALEEFGFTLLEITRFLAEVAVLGIDHIPGEAKVMRRSDLVARVAVGLGWDTTRVEEAVELFVLRPRASLLDAPAEFDAADVYPWRFNRALSYLRRPFVERTTPKGPELAWGTRHVRDANENLLQLCLEGRLRARTTAMQHAITGLRHEQTGAFTEAVAARYRAKPGTAVEKNVKKLGRVLIADAAGNQLGDIDVLVGDPARKIVRSVETKDLSLARTPLEIGQQLRKIFLGGDGRRCDLDRHLARTQWLSDRLPEVLDFLKLATGDAASWSVEPLLVTDERLMTPYVVDVKVPVVALGDLEP